MQAAIAAQTLLGTGMRALPARPARGAPLAPRAASTRLPPAGGRGPSAPSAASICSCSGGMPICAAMAARCSGDMPASIMAICAAIGPTLRERGLIFVGIDVIGDYLTEINVTSPTGAQQLKAFTGIDATALMWDAIEAKRAAQVA